MADLNRHSWSIVPFAPRYRLGPLVGRYTFVRTVASGGAFVAILARFEANALHVWFSSAVDNTFPATLNPDNYTLDDAAIELVTFAGNAIVLALGDFAPGVHTLTIAEGAVRSAAGSLVGPTELAVDLPDTRPPVVTNFDPPPGTALELDSAIVFDVLDDDLVSVTVAADFGFAGTREVVFAAGGFAPRYATSSREEIPGGYRFRISRVGGWPDAGGPTLIIEAVDAAGNRA